MIAHLRQYFGIVGLLSIATWLAGLALLAIHARSPRRTRFWWYAFGLAVLGLILANINSTMINHIQVDTSEDEALADQRRQDEKEEIKPGKPQVRFAEDSPTDKLDLAGKSNEEANAFSYRDQGKQKRVRPTNSAPTMVAMGDKPKVAEVQVRTLKASQLKDADQDDRINLLMARGTFWLALLLVVVDYFSRANKTFDHLTPLPISGRWLDSVYPKALTVCIARRDEKTIHSYLEATIRRGENFIYFGPQDPLPEAWLPRLHLGKWKLGRITKLVTGEGHRSLDDDFVYESAWFSRYCFVILGETSALRFRGQLQKFLETRHLTHASAWRTVHIIWNCRSPIPADDLQKFAYLCREANFKLVVFSDAQPVSTPRIFEEVVA